MLATLLALLSPFPVDVPQVPPPAATPARVLVSGRSATLEHVEVVAVGRQVPATYSPTVGNTDGMSWFVSQHYALKTDHDEATARRYLTYAELAWPLHRAILGRSPPGDDRLRMPFVMGTTNQRMLDAIESDGNFRPESIGGGGITYWRLNTAYNYPSGSLQYHQRDLVLHENLHLMMMCCGAAYPPHRLLEGITHTSSNHVYEEDRQRLTLSVFDKATVNMPTTAELRALRAAPRTFREVSEANSHICVFTSFLWDDPARLLGWREWRDAMLFGGRAAEDLQVMGEVFGPLDGAIERQWQAWLATRPDTFHYRDWGWEQDGETLVAYGWPQQGPYSRTDILLAPGAVPDGRPRLDFPRRPVPTWLGRVERGTAEPVVAAVLDFARNPGRGEVGLGLGVQTARPTAELAYLPVLLRAGRWLLVRGADLGLPDQEIELPKGLCDAAAADGHRFGLRLRLAAHRLEIAVRARAAQGFVIEHRHAVALDPAQRARLLDCPVAVLARDGRPAITPYLEAGQRVDPDPFEPAPANRWRFAGFERLEALYRARRLLGAAAPDSLRAAEADLLAAVDAAPAEQAAAVRRAERRYLSILLDVARIPVDDGRVAAALDCLLLVGVSGDGRGPGGVRGPRRRRRRRSGHGRGSVRRASQRPNRAVPRDRRPRRRGRSRRGPGRRW